ncbi:MAG: GNAT family N-acetyltransferase [Thermoplasmata archaeon]|nr:GNAT family N-acetyltransferase [Thermoplasmata archaeon]
MGAFIDPSAEPSLTADLVNRYREFLVEGFPGWGADQANALVHQWKQGWLRLLVWHPPSRPSRGIAFINRASKGLQVHGLYLDPSGADELTAFLSDVAGEGEGPLHALTDVLPGIDPEDQPRLLEPLGFWHRAKVLMRRGPGLGTLVAADPPVGQLRRIQPTDLDALVGLYARTYTERPGEFWVWSSPDPAADGRDYLLQFFRPDGTWTGEFDPESSALWRLDREVVGCVLVDANRGRGPGVANLMVDPRHQRQGIGRRLMIHALQTLETINPGPVALVAIRGGAPYRLYRDLGFEQVPPPEGRREGHWVRGDAPAGLAAE